MEEKCLKISQNEGMRCSHECTGFKHKNLISKTNIISIVIMFREDRQLAFGLESIKTSIIIWYRVNNVQHLMGRYE